MFDDSRKTEVLVGLMLVCLCYFGVGVFWGWVIWG